MSKFWHLAFGIWHLAFDIRRWPFDIGYEVTS
jgi:hypothetical protein